MRSSGLVSGEGVALSFQKLDSRSICEGDSPAFLWGDGSVLKHEASVREFEWNLKTHLQMYMICQ